MRRVPGLAVAESGSSAVSCETLDRLAAFVELILRWNTRLNLIARGDEPRIWGRHIEDSLQLANLVPPPSRSAIDIGSGGGFPGLVLAIATGLPFRLVESDRRKAAFLREAARATHAPVEIAASRIEQLECQADLVTARAVAPLHRLLEWAHPKLLPNGVCLFLKGRSWDTELATAKSAWHMTVEASASLTSADAKILRIGGLVPR